MISRNPPTAGRFGTTLTEVLMALLVMGIGLVSVATLFPISLLRSVEATQLTNATLLRLNAEARIRASQSTTPTGSAIERGIVEDPDHNGNVWEHDGSKFIYDPLGWTTKQIDGVPVALAGKFGDFDADGLPDATSPINRYSFFSPTELGTLPLTDPNPANPSLLKLARSRVTLPDSFITLADQLAGNFAYTAGPPATITTSGATPSLAEYVNQTVRVTALRADVRASAVRYGTVTGANTISLPDPLPAGPTGYSTANIGRLQIDLPELRYTWFATVRRYGVRPSVTVVSCFRRNFSPEDERVYLCGEPAGSYNEFTYDPSVAANGGAIPPGLKRGGWMFDLYTFRWWKIASVRAPSTAGGVIYFTTDPEEIDPSPRPRGVSTLSGPVYAIFPRNVIEAYTLKKE